MTAAADPDRLSDGGASALVDRCGRQGGAALRWHLILTAPAKAGAWLYLLAPLVPLAGGLVGAKISAPWTPATATPRFRQPGRGH